jgi:hypothetical protein
MGLLNYCPLPTYMASVVTDLNPCPINLGQIQKMIFWRTGNGCSVASALTSAFWTTHLALTTTAKPVVSPFVVGKLTPGEPREFGGGNETLDGIPIRIGNLPSNGEFTTLQQDQDVITKLKALQCEALDVVFINEGGQFYYSDSNALGFGGFRLKSMVVSDVEGGEFNGVIKNKIKFSLVPDWSDTAELSAATTFALNLVNT